MSIQIYYPAVIINIIINNFFPFRGFSLTKEIKNNVNDINNEFKKNGYLRIDGINNKNPRGNRKYIIFIIIENKEINNFEMRKNKNIIDNINNEENYKNNLIDEIFILLSKDFLSKKNFIDLFSEYYKQKNGVDNDGKFLFYTICPYEKFIFDPTICKEIPPHEIMSNEEVNELLKEEKINLKSLPIILNNEIIIIWIGGRIGQVVKITRNSETSLQSIYYRRIDPYFYIK